MKLDENKFSMESQKRIHETEKERQKSIHETEKERL